MKSLPGGYQLNECPDRTSLTLSASPAVWLTSASQHTHTHTPLLTLPFTAEEFVKSLPASTSARQPCLLSLSRLTCSKPHVLTSQDPDTRCHGNSLCVRFATCKWCTSEGSAFVLSLWVILSCLHETSCEKFLLRLLNSPTPP